MGECSVAFRLIFLCFLLRQKLLFPVVALNFSALLNAGVQVCITKPNNEVLGIETKAVCIFDKRSTN